MCYFFFFDKPIIEYKVGTIVNFSKPILLSLLNGTFSLSLFDLIQYKVQRLPGRLKKKKHFSNYTTPISIKPGNQTRAMKVRDSQYAVLRKYST